jgi:hypothetical protein
MPRGWFPDVSTFWTWPWTSRPVGWSALRTMETGAPGTTWLVFGTAGMAGDIFLAELEIGCSCCREISVFR